MKRLSGIQLVGYCTVILFLLNISFVVAAYNVESAIEPNGSVYESISFSCSEDDENYAENLLFTSQNNCTIEHLNMTQFERYISGLSYSPSGTWANKTQITEPISLSILRDTYFVYVFLDDNDKVRKYHAEFVILIMNEAGITNYYSLKLENNSEVFTFVREFLAHMLSLSYFVLGITLYIKSRQELRENEALKSKLFRNYAIGYTLGGIGTLIWKIDMWFSTIHPEQNWLRPLYLDIGLAEISDSYLTIITFFFLGFSVMFMSLTVEKDVLQRKKPWITLHLLIITCLLVPFSFNPISLNIIIIWWILALVIAVTNIGLIYLRIILKSRGNIRKITLFVVIGFLGTFLCVIFRDFGNFDYIFNILAIIFAIVFYYGMTKT